jgi:hypothetical protein
MTLNPCSELSPSKSSDGDMIVTAKTDIFPATARYFVALTCSSGEGAVTCSSGEGAVWGGHGRGAVG